MYSLFKKIVISIFILGTPVMVFSQGMANYVVTRTTSISYSSISGTGSSFSSWRNAAPGTSQDDNRSNLTNIGFDFWYNGTRYTQFSVSTNGFIDFSASAADGNGTAAYGYSNAAFYGNGAANGTWLSIAPFYDDMTTQGGGDPLGSSIKYLTSGSSPNRVLTVEWINMALYGNTAPDIDFQLKLYETTGVIEFVYDTMATGGASFTYTNGINAASLANTPATSEMKCQQTANTTTFNNTEPPNLTTLPASQSKITLTPPVTTPASPSGTIAFSAITSTGMTLTWTNWCTNEIGYVLYNSTDGTNYNFVTQTAADATNYAATGLLPSTLYYWKMYAVKEGYVSASVNNSQSTSAGGTKTSNVVTGNWNTGASWTPVGVPTAGDNVIIANGHTITIDVNAACNNLTVGQGASGILSIGNDATVRTITVNSNLIINSGASFITNTASNATHLLTLKGNVTNSGTLNFRSDANSLCNSTFSKNGSQTVSGAGATNSFNLITANMGSTVSNTLEFTSTNFSAPTNFLTLTMGTFKLSTTGTVNITPYTGLATLTANNAFNINSSTATVNFTGGINLYGNLSISNGILAIGDAADENLQSLGGTFQISGGTITIAGRYYTPDINNLALFSMSSGTLTLPTVSSTSTTLSPFHINATGSTFTMSNGTIVLQREGGGGAQDLGFTLSNLTSNSITGGTLQIGNASTPATQIMSYTSSYNIGALTVNSANATAKLLQNSTVLNAVTLSAGTLNANNFNITVGGNWVNNATYTPVTNTITFNGTSTVSGSSITTFSGVTISGALTGHSTTMNVSGNFANNGTYTHNSGTVVFNGTTTVSGSSTTTFSGVTISGALTGHSGTMNIARNFANNGTFTHNSGTVAFNGSVAQTISGSSSTTFRNLTINNTSGVSITSGTYFLEEALTLSNGTFATGGNSFTMKSDATRTARIAPVTGTGAVTGNFTIQRYIPSRGTLSWANLSSPVVSTTVQDWDDELYFEYPYSYPTVVGNVLIYNEAIADYVQVAPASVITPGLGFEIYLSDDGTYSTFSNTTINTIGVPYIGTKNLSLTYTPAISPYEGQNLIGNPFASAIDLSLITKTNALSSVDVYDNVSHSYLTLTGAAVIAPHQGFWAYATSGGASFSIPETAKTTSTTSNIKSNELLPFFQLTISSADGANEMAHTLKIAADENAQDGWDMQDHPFRKSPDKYAPFITANCEKFALSISTFNSGHETYSMPLNTKVGFVGKYQITRKGIEFINTIYSCVVLEDKVLGKLIDLNKVENYLFSAVPNDNQNRFVLHFSKTGDCKSVDNYSEGNTFNNGVQVFQTDNGVVINFNLDETVSSKISISNILGQEMIEQISLDATKQSIKINVTSDFHGVYFVKVTSEKGEVLKKFVRL